MLQMLQISIFCLGLCILGLLLISKRIHEDVQLNYAMIQSIFAYLHKNYGVTVYEIKDILKDYGENRLDYIGGKDD